MKNLFYLFIILSVLNLASCEFSWSTDNSKDDTNTDVQMNNTGSQNVNGIDKAVQEKITEFNECLKNDDVTPCKDMVAKDSGSISGTDAVREVLSKFPPYMKAMVDIEFIEQKSTKADRGERVYVVIGKAKFSSAGQIMEMYTKYNLVEQNGLLKIYGIEFDPNKLNAEF